MFLILLLSSYYYNLIHIITLHFFSDLLYPYPNHNLSLIIIIIQIINIAEDNLTSHLPSLNMILYYIPISDLYIQYFCFITNNL
jgi:hypothetical protein